MSPRIALALAAALLVAGCEKMMRDMYDQPRYKPLAASRFFADERSSRPPVADTVPSSAGTEAGATSGRLGKAPPQPTRPTIYPPLARGGASSKTPPDWVPRLDGIPRPVTAQLMQRGQQRFDIYCAPCHSPLGDGDGMVARRGFVHPPSYHSARLRNAPDEHFYDVITSGYGAMYSYADRIAPDDRWAIVAYIRALQLSQHTPAKALPAAEQHKLAEAAK